jgi:UDPglucose 6-dehydrogenase/GDP-mannose 6-dehydrogenase
MRESPAIPLVKQLTEAGAKVKAFDPIAMNESKHMLKDVPLEYAPSLEAVLEGVDAALLVTRWPEFSKVTELLKPHQLLIDGRRMIEPQLVERYEGIGR